MKPSNYEVRQMDRKVMQAVLLAGFVMTGCTSGNVGIMEQADNVQESSVNYNNTVLATRVKIQNIRSRQVDNLLQVSVELHNLWDATLDFQYKFRFFDKDGFEVAADGRPWTPVLLKGNDTVTAQAVAPNPTAVSFKIYVHD